MPTIEIYTTMTCPYCMRAKMLLQDKGVGFKEINVNSQPGLRQKMTERANGGYTVPQIFINDEHIGGCDELYALERAGKLDEKLNAA
jgi:glutaredoxin 3